MTAEAGGIRIVRRAALSKRDVVFLSNGRRLGAWRAHVGGRRPPLQVAIGVARPAPPAKASALPAEHSRHPLAHSWLVLQELAPLAASPASMSATAVLLRSPRSYRDTA